MPPSCRLKGYCPAPVSSSLAFPAASWKPRLRPRPSTAAHGFTIPSRSLLAPWLRGLRGLGSPHHQALDAPVAAKLENATWWFHSLRSLAVVDPCRLISNGVTPEDGWHGTILRGYCRWSAACCMERVDVRWALARTVELLPLKRPGQSAPSFGMYVSL